MNQKAYTEIRAVTSSLNIYLVIEISSKIYSYVDLKCVVLEMCYNDIISAKDMSLLDKCE